MKITNGTDDRGFVIYNIGSSLEYDVDSMALDYAHLYESLLAPEDYLIYQDVCTNENMSDEDRKEIFSRVQEDLVEITETFRSHLITGDISEEKSFLDDLVLNIEPDDPDCKTAKEILDNIYVYNNYLDSKDKRTLDVDEEDLYRKASEIAERVIEWTEKVGKVFAPDIVRPLDETVKKEDVYERIIDRQFKKETEYIEQIVAVLSELEDAELTDEQKAVIEEGKTLVKDLCKIDLDLAVLEAKNKLVEKESTAKDKESKKIKSDIERD